MKEVSVRVIVLAVVVLLLSGCGQQSTPTPSGALQSDAETPAVTKGNISGTVRDCIEGSLKSDLEKLEPTLIIELVQYKVLRDEVGIAVEALWDSKPKPGGGPKGQPGGSVGPPISTVLLGRPLTKSRLRYDADGKFVRRIVNDQNVTVR